MKIQYCKQGDHKMKRDELLEQLQQAMMGSHPESPVIIEVFAPGSIGGRPNVGIKQVVAGFDWDHGKIIISPSEPLTTLTVDEVAAITESVRKNQSWHAYQAYKAMQREIQEASDKVAAAQDTCDKQALLIARLNARIDALMLEYCPQDMTPEQRAAAESALPVAGDR